MSFPFITSPLVSLDPLKFQADWVENMCSDSDTVWIGFSGGVDSHVLLHAIAGAVSDKRREKLAVIHIHHGLSANADAWLTHCESVCVDLGVRFVSKRVILTRQASVEDAARQARYQAFEELLGCRDVLLLAHHAGDQVETVLFRLLRGTGGKGLSGIPQERNLGRAKLYRPLLDVSKASILTYAKECDLHWIEDESNTDDKFTRNFLRHRVLPTLETRFPQMERSIAFTARRVSMDYEMLSYLAENQLACWISPCGGLILSHLADLSLDKRLFWLRHFLQIKDISLTYAQLESLDLMVFSAEDKQPEFCFSSGRIMRYQNIIYLLPEEQPPLLGELNSGQTFERAFDRVLVEGDGHFSLRKRPQGASLLLSNGHRRKLKKWLNDEKVPGWWREHLPYLYLEDELIAIGLLWRHPSYLNIKIDWYLNEVLPFPSLEKCL